MVDCKLLSSLVGIDQLANFERIAGSFHLDKKKLKMRALNKYGWPHVIIPDYTYDNIDKFSEPFQGINFKVRDKQISVSVFSSEYPERKQHLSNVATSKTYIMIREKSLFSYLDKVLGVYAGVANFCADMPEISVSMFMASVVLPIDGNLTQVYRLKNPDGLLLLPAAEKKTAAYFIFPNPKNIDALDYAIVDAPEADIIKIVNALKSVH